MSQQPNSTEVIAEDESLQGEEQVMQSVRTSRIIIPMLIGLGVVAYMLYTNWDTEAFASIKWDTHKFTWIGLAIAFVIIRHLAYTLRLRILTDKFFSWKKSIELIFIWEFSSAISPTSVGGAAVALFVLAQEKLGAARTTALILYTIVIDTLFFVSFIPLMLLIFGPGIVPKLRGTALGEWTFYVTFGIMIIYGAFFFYGLFFNPKGIKSLVLWVTSIRFLKRFRPKAEELGNDIIVAAKEIRRRNWKFHVKAYLATAVAWSTRFIILNCLIIAFANPDTMSYSLWVQGELYAKLQSLFVILLLLPSPGGAGFAEVVFGQFLTQAGFDVVKGVSLIVALIWRLISYYPYLIAGAIIVPWWVKRRVEDRRRRKLEENVAS